MTKCLSCGNPKLRPASIDGKPGLYCPMCGCGFIDTDTGAKTPTPPSPTLKLPGLSQGPSSVEKLFLEVWTGPAPVTEFRFAPPRRFRFDYAWPNSRVAVEADGHVHRIKNRFQSDIEKSNLAVSLGWKVFRYSSKSINADPIGFTTMVADALKVAEHICWNDTHDLGIGLEVLADSLRAALERAEAAERQFKGALKDLRETEQILGKALGYPWYKDDQENFPGTTDDDGVCVGDHVPATLALEAARRIDKLETALDRTKPIVAMYKKATDTPKREFREEYYEVAEGGD